MAAFYFAEKYTIKIDFIVYRDRRSYGKFLKKDWSLEKARFVKIRKASHNKAANPLHIMIQVVERIAIFEKPLSDHPSLSC